MGKILTIIIFLLTSLYAHTQVQQAWVSKQRYTSHSQNNYGNTVITDAAGNIYVMFTTVADIDFANNNVSIPQISGSITLKNKSSYP